MGFKANELVPFAAQVSPTTPVAKEVKVKAFQITRSDTTAVIKAALPQSATIIDITVYSPVISNAATTAVVSVGTSVTATELLTSVDVKTAAGIIRPTSEVAATFLLTEPVPTTGVDINIWAKYAETGAASSAGGPYTVFVSYAA